MGCDHCGQRLSFLRFSLLFLIVSSWSHHGFVAEGRKSLKQKGSQQVVSEDDKTMMRAQIGSRPPRCEKRCRSCEHCEAIQVPTNPQAKNNSKLKTIAYASGEDNSNYKPMSWKCKCGNLIFNP
ncbi:hypothetical protein HN51_068336 [Arachis hypogaea]|uniref:Epidermal patterning factor-like protein n=1 Tax=Arachis hypogaea TaxID=3818 RepID=A0A444ZAT1_ARAHY|nr:EPIDERMAL PATTERNING FACTOR-like protein 2 [Arachis hypogaea]XP_025703301.1 EPIDERMAL PATTERNING FACTOR-like protein 2 [Arachis hypogaea]QHO40562.1 EPIDERMAL PATTERNING FACTOR-like protein [Arachis hypogaea]RYR11289.1 hypothetical protein Ahy_B05g079753 [Arachis hypogaea]